MCGRSVSCSVPFCYDIEPVEAALPVRYAGDQRKQILAVVDEAGCRFIAFVDLFVNHLIGEGVPIVFYNDFVADIEVWYVIKEDSADKT